MGEERQQSCPAAGTSALDRPRRHVQDGGGLGHGVALHVDQDQGGPLLHGERPERPQQFPVELAPLGGGRGGLMGFEQFLELLLVRDRSGAA